MMSSYARNNLGEIFTTYIKCFRYTRIVELGVLDGYSAAHIARGLRVNKERWGLEGHLDAHDLWELYPYRHGDMQKTQRFLDDAGLSQFVTLMQNDAFNIHQEYADKSVHFLHIDISNTGEILKRIMELWDRKIVQGGIIAFEGGSEERDQVAWMIKYNKPPIKPELESNYIIKQNYIYATYLQWPSLTILYKKWENI